MIVFQGEPKLQEVPKTSLQWASNTESDVFFDKAGKEKMKAYKDELSGDEIKELVAYVRKFKS